ncbi:hypothetical protein FACS1894184_15700 [Clostridia bacterium]|nr:hypothetical protein FACS1894184_15700 [Clostridia bacterium]
MGYRVGLLTTYVSKTIGTGLYNEQDVGLAKALSTYFTDVVIYRYKKIGAQIDTELLTSNNKIQIKYIPMHNIGVNGIINCTLLDNSLDLMVYFTDIQLSIPLVSYWAKRNKVPLLFYIGTTSSRSDSRVVRFLMNTYFNAVKGNIKCNICLAKTNYVYYELLRFNVKQVLLAPVGLDLDLLNIDFKKQDRDKLRLKYGYKPSDFVVIFVGRLVEEKRPLDLIKIIAPLLKTRLGMKLIIVGNGDQEVKLIGLIQLLKLDGSVKLIREIQNSDIWELYYISDRYVNLNKREIFGMSILEAMYYNCTVIAHSAPGPDYIIQNEVTGWLFEDDLQLSDILQKSIPLVTQGYIIKNFTWETAAKRIMEVYSENIPVSAKM